VYSCSKLHRHTSIPKGLGDASQMFSCDSRDMRKTANVTYCDPLPLDCSLVKLRFSETSKWRERDKKYIRLSLLFYITNGLSSEVFYLNAIVCFILLHLRSTLQLDNVLHHGTLFLKWEH
jgi:hypothetical protein